MENRVCQRCTSIVSSISRPLLKLKLSFFLVYSVWFSAFPYVSLLSTQIVSFKQLAIIHACVPVSSVVGPVITGFVADKIGNYKIILVCTCLLGALFYQPVLWIHQAMEDFRPVPNQSDVLNANSTFDQRDEGSWTALPDYVFPVLLVARVLSFYAFDATNSLLDAVGLAMAKKHGGDFGQQKMFSMLSMVVVPLLCGVLIDFISDFRGFRDASVAFYTSAVAAIAVAPLVLQLDVDVQKNQESVVHTVKKVMGMVDVNAFFLAESVVGICFGWHRSFLIVYADAELRASKSLLGASFGIGGLGSMVMFSTANLIIGRLGAPHTVVLALSVTSIRFISYYYLTTPWVLLISESFDGLSGFLAIVAGSYYCAANAPPGMLASLNGIMTAAVFGIGRGVGLTIGSLLIAEYGIRFTYLTFGAVAGGTAVTYMAVYHGILKDVERKRRDHPKGPQSTGTSPPDEESAKGGVDNLASCFQEGNESCSK